jgi:hypothetical protein
VPHGGICLAPSRGCSAVDFEVLLGREERVSGGVEVFIGLEHGFGGQRDSGILAREEFMQLADDTKVLYKIDFTSSLQWENLCSRNENTPKTWQGNC